MNSTDIWCRFCSSAIRSRICFWIVTSSAVVGSSAISSFGSQAIAIAIITRCCWPPDICDGIGVDPPLGLGNADLAQQLDRALARLRARHAHVQPQHFLELQADGEHRVQRRHRLLEDHRDVGAAQLAQLADRQRRASCGRRRGSRLAGSTIEFSGGSRPSIASDVTDLPLPDSPTSATVLLRGMSNEMPLTASNVVCGRGGTRCAGCAR